MVEHKMTRQTHTLYTIAAKYYDPIYKNYLEKTVPKLVDMLEKAIKKHAERPVKEILDIACGTGGPTIEIAKRGYKTTGVDLHKEMIEIARQKTRKHNLKINYQVKDMRKINYKEKYDAITIFFTSINYNQTPQQLQIFLKKTHKALRPGGILVADATNPLALAKKLGRQNTPIIWDTTTPENEKLVITDYKELEDARQILHFKRIITIIKNNGETKTYHMHDTLGLYTKNEIELIAQQAGYRKTHIYGDINLENPEPKNTERFYIIMVK